MILIALLVVIFILIYILAIKPYDYWTDRGVKQRKQIYLLGDNAKVIFKQESFFEMIKNAYDAFPEERYFGFYQTTLPTLVLRDPELMKQIAVKEFDHFLDHRQSVPDGVDPIFTKNLFSLRGKAWRNMRTTLSPSFTSSKMRLIFNLISDCAHDYMKYLNEANGINEIELKDLCTRYTNDVIATVAFGIKCDSFNDRENDFYVMGKVATTFTFWRNLKFLAYALVPGFFKLLGVKLFPQSVTDFFTQLVSETIRTREEKGIVRPDMLQLLMEARKGKRRFEEDSEGIADTGFATVEETRLEQAANENVKQELTDLDIAAQALIFFFGGFETVSTLMCFLGYELTLNPDIQTRLQEEIDETIEECKGKLTYEALTKMKYMDMVVSESLRKWPAGVVLDRVCTKEFTINAEKTGERPIHLKRGDIVWFPVAGIHRDPKYYPNPDKFDPERFNDENKHEINPYTYLPFGLGPRNCIGSRFALLEVKTIFFHLLSRFDFVVTKKTPIPLRLNRSSFNMMAEGGFWVGLKSRAK